MKLQQASHQAPELENHTLSGIKSEEASTWVSRCGYSAPTRALGLWIEGAIACRCGIRRRLLHGQVST